MASTADNLHNNPKHKEYAIRHWRPGDREGVVELIRDCLKPYGIPLDTEKGGADEDALKVEEFYERDGGGEFFVAEKSGSLVGTAAYYQIERGAGSVEVRKMYIIPECRRCGLGKKLMEVLESAIRVRGFKNVYVETASVLVEACKFYPSLGYAPVKEKPETKRCDLLLHKSLA